MVSSFSEIISCWGRIKGCIYIICDCPCLNAHRKNILEERFMCTSLTDLEVHSGNTDKGIESYRQRESEAAAMAKGLCALGNPGNKIEPSLAPLLLH